MLSTECAPATSFAVCGVGHGCHALSYAIKLIGLKRMVCLIIVNISQLDIIEYIEE